MGRHPHGGKPLRNLHRSARDPSYLTPSVFLPQRIDPWATKKGKSISQTNKGNKSYHLKSTEVWELFLDIKSKEVHSSFIKTIEYPLL